MRECGGMEALAQFSQPHRSSPQTSVLPAQDMFLNGHRALTLLFVAYFSIISAVVSVMRCSIFSISFVLPLIAYVLHIGFWPLPEQAHPAAIDTSAFDDLSPIDAAERLLELIAIATVTQRGPLSNVSAALMLKLHQSQFTFATITF
jgi:hypothetical protein